MENICSSTSKIDERTYDNIQKILNGYRDDFISGRLLDYTYFKEN